jgi:hypothetical protein
LWLPAVAGNHKHISNQRLQSQSLSSWWWEVCPSKHVEQLTNIGVINSTTRSHLFGYFYKIYIIIHGSINIKLKGVLCYIVKVVNLLQVHVPSILREVSYKVHITNLIKPVHKYVCCHVDRILCTKPLSLDGGTMENSYIEYSLRN